MGQYYKFVNPTKKSESTIPLPFNFNLPWAKGLENYSREELQEKFDFVIQNNNWHKDDGVIAIGDYGAIFYYPEEWVLKVATLLWAATLHPGDHPD